MSIYSFNLIHYNLIKVEEEIFKKTLKKGCKSMGHTGLAPYLPGLMVILISGIDSEYLFKKKKEYL